MPSSAELYNQGLEAIRKGDQEQSLILNRLSLELATSDVCNAALRLIEQREERLNGVQPTLSQ